MASRRAALRLGFTFEGIFRQHLVVKGRNRDTAWFSILDHEWPTRPRLPGSAPDNFDAGPDSRSLFRPSAKSGRCCARSGFDDLECCDQFRPYAQHQQCLLALLPFERSMARCTGFP
ncbi:MAG: GNAT family protein [Geminicoccaceae bacterium]